MHQTWFRLIAVLLLLSGCSYSPSWLGTSSGDRFRQDCSGTEDSPGLLVRCERQAREDAAQQRDDSCNRRYSSDRKARERCLGAKP